MREVPILLPVFTTSVPLDFPSEGTFAFNKKTNKQLEVTVRINEHQYFNMNFLNHDGYIMACCRWAHVLDFTENGLDRIQMMIKRHFRKKYPVISSLYGQHTDTAEDIHISTIGFEGNPKEWYISMRIYGEKFEDLMHGNPADKRNVCLCCRQPVHGKRGCIQGNHEERCQAAESAVEESDRH